MGLLGDKAASQEQLRRQVHWKSPDDLEATAQRIIAAVGCYEKAPLLGSEVHLRRKQADVLGLVYGNRATDFWIVAVDLTPAAGGGTDVEAKCISCSKAGEVSRFLHQTMKPVLDAIEGAGSASVRASGAGPAASTSSEVARGPMTAASTATPFVARSGASRAKRFVAVAAVVLFVLASANLTWWLLNRSTDSGTDAAPSQGGCPGSEADCSPLEQPEQAKEGPPIADDDARSAVIDAATTFTEAFNTYGPDDLDSGGHLPGYAATADLMTNEFGSIFRENLAYAEQTVAELGVEATASVYGSGVSLLDADTATVLVGSTIELSYPSPSGEDVSTGPQRARYVVSLVNQGANWLVSDVNDIDDGRPPLGAPGSGGELELPPSGFVPGHWTSSAIDAAQNALQLVLSYDYRDLSTVDAASAYLTPDFAASRQDLFTGLAPQIERDKVVVASEGVAFGLARGDADRVEVFTFLDQVSTKGEAEPRTERLWATVVLQHDGTDGWLIDDISTED
jgi:Mce-associated membrane protein